MSNENSIERELNRLVRRWEQRADLFGEGHESARKCAALCASELQEVIDTLEDD